MEGLYKMIDELLKEEPKNAPAPVPTKSGALKYVFSIYKASNGHIVSCGGKHWVCPDDRDLLDVVKIAIADTKL